MSIWLFALTIAAAALLAMSFLFYRGRMEDGTLPTTYVIDGHAVSHEAFHELKRHLTIDAHPQASSGESPEHGHCMQYTAHHTETGDAYIFREYRATGGTITYAITRAEDEMPRA